MPVDLEMSHEMSRAMVRAPGDKLHGPLLVMKGFKHSKYLEEEHLVPTQVVSARFFLFLAWDPTN